MRNDPQRQTERGSHLNLEKRIFNRQKAAFRNVFFYFDKKKMIKKNNIRFHQKCLFRSKNWRSNIFSVPNGKARLAEGFEYNEPGAGCRRI